MEKKNRQKNITAFSLVELSIVILVIGIILVGVTQGSIIISKYRLSTARNLTQNSPLTSMPGLTFWLETTSENSFTDIEIENGDIVSNWRDINPQNTSPYIATADADEEPTYETDCLNSLPCLSFDGTDDYIEISEQFSFGNFTIFIVADIGDEDEIGYLLHTVYSTLADQGRIHMLTASSDNMRFSQTYADGTINLTNLSENSLDNKESPHIFEAYEDDEEIYFFVKGTEGESTTTDIDPDASRDVDGFGFGAFHGFGNPSNFLSGKIGEVIFFDRALKTSEINDIREYLAQKWQ